MSRWKTWLGLAVSLAAIAWAVRGVEWGEVGEALAEADYAVLAVVFVMSAVVNIGTRGLRWWILLLPAPRPARFGSCLRATAIGLLANNVLPARIGEFVRAWALGRRDRIPTGTAFGGLFVERMLDGFALVGLLYGLTFLHDFPPWVETTARVAFFIFLGFLGFQVVLVLWPRAFLALVRTVSSRVLGGRFAEPLERTIVAFIDGIHLLTRPGLIVVSVVLAFVQWSLVAVTYWLALVAFGLEAQVGWVGAFFTNSVTTLGVAVPSSPGFVGTFQAFVVKSLEVFGVDKSMAFSYSVGYHIVNYTGVTAIGLWVFLREGLSWRQLERSEEVLERELEEEFETAIEPVLESDSLPPKDG